MPAAIYCRISDDKTGERDGVDRQEADCRALAARLGWDVVAVYVDNDISAYSGKPRPQYRAMLAAVKEGRVTGIVAWHTDRLHRRATELESFVNLAESHGLQVETVRSGKIDLTTPSGRMMARQHGSIAQYEVEQARDRMRRAKQQAAEQGRFRGGRRPFGYEKDGVTVREAEARIISECTEGVLAGRSLKAMSRELRERGVLTSRGNHWKAEWLREMLLRPRNAGLIGSVGGSKTRPAQWPAIVDEDTWRSCVTRLTDPERRTNHVNIGMRWLGSMAYRCGRCGAPMRPSRFGGVAAGRPETSRGFHYRCQAKAHLTIHAVKTDDYIRRVVAEMVRDPRVVAGLTPADTDGEVAADRTRRAVLEANLVRFDGDYKAGLLTAQERKQFRLGAEEEINAINARLAAWVETSTASPILTASDPGAAFQAAPIDVQRAVLAAVLTVEVLPSTRRGAAWTPERLRLTPVVAVDAER